MRLAAVVGLAIEEMIERGGEYLLDIGGIAEGAIADDASEVRLAQTFDIFVDCFVLGAPRRAKLSRILEQNDIEAFRQLALAGESLHPDAIADQQMVEGAVQ